MRESGFWVAIATEVLRCYLMAAAMEADGSSFDMQGQSHNPDDAEPLRTLETHSPPSP